MTYKEEYLVQNIAIGNINKTIKNHILEHKTKFIRFKFDCKIVGMIDKYTKNNKVNLHILFFSETENSTHYHYLKFPKRMTEIRLLKILDVNPLLIKTLGACLDPIPLVNLILYKYSSYINNRNQLVDDYNWYENIPKSPSQEILELMRSY